MDKIFLACSATFGFLGVALGAFGAHGLKSKLSPDLMGVYQTGVLYHLVHALAIGLVGVAITRWPSTLMHSSGWMFCAGILLFSGSLYALAISGVRVLGAITPFGGLCFLLGWALLGAAVWRG